MAEPNKKRTTPQMNKLSRIYLRDLELIATSKPFRLRTRNKVFISPLLIILGIMGLVVANDPSNGRVPKKLGRDPGFRD
jgi:hypothetical protein